jgi:hypothetical protein
VAEAAVPLAIVSGGTQLFGAVSRNRSLARSARSARDAANIQVRQVDAAAALEQRKRAIDTARQRASLRVLAAESGLDFSGSFADVDRSQQEADIVDRQIIETNRVNQRQAILSGLNATLAERASEMVNPLLSAFQGSLSGYQTGLQIEGAQGQAEATARSTAGSSHRVVPPPIDGSYGPESVYNGSNRPR